MSKIRYLLDENVDPLFRRELLRREPNLIVWRVGDVAAPPVATLDPDILIWCEAHDFVLVTNNRHSMPQHLRDHLDAGRHIPGIIELNPQMSIGVTLDDLWLIWAVAHKDEYRDNIIYLPLG